MSHSETIELLPWLVNGTLSPEAAAELRRELRASEPLRRELRETVETARLLAEPPSVEALVDFASGRPSEDAELIERLVETMPEWAEQVQLARRSFALQDESIALLGGRRRRRGAATVPSYWRPTAIAASLAAVVALTGWLGGWLDGWRPNGPVGPTTSVGTPWQARPQLGVPQADVTVLDLVASSFIRRDGAGTAATQTVRLAELGEALVLILASDSARDFERYELELVGPAGSKSTLEVTRSPQHDYTLLVPRALLAQGTYAIQVHGRTAAGAREPLESYELRVEP